MLKLVTLMSCVCICFVALSCNETAIPPAGSSNVIMPLRVNNTWEYEVILFDTAGNRTASFRDTMAIVAELEIGAEKWFVDDDGVIQMNRATGRWVFSGVPYLAEKYPASLNDAYMLSDSITVVYVAGTGETVRVPYGTFSTYVYRRIRNGVLTAELYFAPNTGLVRLDRYSLDADRVYRSESRILHSTHLQ